MDPPGYLSWQGSRQKAAQTNSVAARLTAIQPSPRGAAERLPRGLRPAPLRPVPHAGPLRTRRLSLVPSAGGGATLGWAVASAKLADASVPVRGHTVKGCAAGRTFAVARRARHSDLSARKAPLGAVRRSANRPATELLLTSDFAPEREADGHPFAGHPSADGGTKVT